MNLEQERLNFETMLRKHSNFKESYLNKTEAGAYDLNSMETAWQGWIMAREYDEQNRPQIEG